MAGIKDVAREAGVSIATVSYVLNGTRRVSPETVELVEMAAKKLNYTPDYSAQALRTRRSNAIAFITHRLTNDYFPNVIEAAENVLSAKGYSLILGLSQNDPVDELNEFRNMLRRKVGGIIIAPSQMEYNYRQLCPDEKYPLLFVDRIPISQAADCVSCDNYHVFREAIDVLVKKGHRHIAFVNVKYDQNHEEFQLSTQRDRARAYFTALEDHGMSDYAHYYDNGATTRSDGYNMMREILNCEDITACIMCNGVMAQGAMLCLKDNEISIPGRMALVSIDAYNWSRLVTPTLSTIEQPTSEVGRLAAEMILERIENPDIPYRKIQLGSKLVLRESC